MILEAIDNKAKKTYFVSSFAGLHNSGQQTLLEFIAVNANQFGRLFQWLFGRRGHSRTTFSYELN